VWRSWLARRVWDAEVGGSSPLTPTIIMEPKLHEVQKPPPDFIGIKLDRLSEDIWSEIQRLYCREAAPWVNRHELEARLYSLDSVLAHDWQSDEPISFSFSSNVTEQTRLFVRKTSDGIVKFSLEPVTAEASQIPELPETEEKFKQQSEQAIIRAGLAEPIYKDEE
jgi:hypothetical protein